MGKLEAIWLKRARRGPMDAVPEAALKANLGLVNNANQGGKRQVTIIEKEVWDMLIAELGTRLDPAVRRANLMISGVSLLNSHRKVLQIGPYQMQIYCRTMDEALPGLQDARRPDWGGGAFGVVLNDGLITVGDPVLITAINY
ncbi:MAG: sulfurase [Okeania sp. SIO3B3]|nr:sulfurase [Okeania sp. SIO3B3]